MAIKFFGSNSLTQLITLIKNKFDALATVAKTGSYNDLNGKPTIPDAQIQSDWNQTNTAAKDYIKNKPTISFNFKGEAESDSDFKDQAGYGYFGEETNIGDLIGSDGSYMFIPYGRTSRSYGWVLACNDDGDELYLGRLDGEEDDNIDWYRIYHTGYQPGNGSAAVAAASWTYRGSKANGTLYIAQSGVNEVLIVVTTGVPTMTFTLPADAIKNRVTGNVLIFGATNAYCVQIDTSGSNFTFGVSSGYTAYFYTR